VLPSAAGNAIKGKILMNGSIYPAPLLFVLAICAHAESATDVVCSGCIGNADIAVNAVSSGKIVDSGVLARDLASGAVTANKLATSAVTSAKIKDGAVAKVDLASSVQDQLSGALANLTTTRVQKIDPSVTSATCPADTLPVGATCDCSNSNGTRNFGVLFACQITTTGAAAGCYNEAYSYDPQLPVPLARVSAVCLGATLNDGTAWTPASALFSIADGSREPATDNEAAVQALREQVADHSSRLTRTRQ
jgi:hypothetical protein